MTNKVKNGFIIAILSLNCQFLISCQKTATLKGSPATINIINAMPESQAIITVFGDQEPYPYYGSALQIRYGGTAVYSESAGTIPIQIMQNDDTSLSPKQSLFSGAYNFLPGNIYSLFCIGDTTSMDTLLLQDHIPILTDSMSGIRFVNLCQSKEQLLISSQGTSGNFSTATLSYKSVTDWNYFPSTSAQSGYYAFTIQDASTGNILKTCYWIYTVNKCNTMVITNIVSGGVNVIITFPMNNF